MTITALASEQELRWLRETLAELSIRYNWDDCALWGSPELERWSDRLGGDGTSEIIVCDLSVSGALASLRRLRSRHAAALVVPITNPGIAPSDYVQPEIMPCALLWSPLIGPGNREVLRNVLEHAYSAAGEGREDRIMVGGRRETRWIPLAEILFFEAREKKVFARLREQEIAVNETISALEQHWPERFVRCHKGFLVNLRHVARVDWAELTMYVSQGLTVPISRGYRAAVKEMFHGIE